MHYFIYINNNALLSYYSIILTIVTNSNFKNTVKTLKDKKSKKIKQKNFVGKKKERMYIQFSTPTNCLHNF